MSGRNIFINDGDDKNEAWVWAGVKVGVTAGGVTKL
jgi:hypothetical protein